MVRRPSPRPVHGLETGEASRNQHDRISLTELYEYTHKYVTARNPKQTPLMWSFGIEGDLYIARTVPLASRTRGRRDYSVLSPQRELPAGAEVFSVAISPDNRDDCGGGAWGSSWCGARMASIHTWTSPPEPTRLEDVHERFVYPSRSRPAGRRLATGGEDGVAMCGISSRGSSGANREHRRGSVLGRVLA